MDLGEFLLPGTGLRPLGLIIAPGLVAILAVPTASIAVTGEVRWFETTAESGATAQRGFCPTCGTALFAQSKGASAAFRSVRAASLDDASWFEPSAEIFTRSAQSWAPMNASTRKFETTPSV